MKALSYNIHKGFNIQNTKYLLSEMKSAIHKYHCDLVFLQEITGLHLDNHEQAQFEFLADSLWHHYAYGKNAITSKGHHGNAILSKFPFVFQNNINISTNRFEQRGLLHGVIEHPKTGKTLHLLCVHLNLLHQSRVKQFHLISDYINKNILPHEPIIFAGDFNDWNKELDQLITEQLHLQESHVQVYGKHSITFPSFMPILSLDRIYTRGIKIKHSQTLSDNYWKNLSDHLPLIIEFEPHSFL